MLKSATYAMLLHKDACTVYSFRFVCHQHHGDRSIRRAAHCHVELRGHKSFLNNKLDTLSSVY